MPEPDILTTYKHATAPLPARNLLWPLYGAGFENLGRDGQLIETGLPSYNRDQLLIRHDATGICFSDIKVIRAGQDHPRIYRDMAKDPVVLGHEVSLTVVGVGEALRDQYRPGDRFVLQADISVGGVGYAYGYEIQGGFSQYNVIDQRILSGDDGNYLIPVRPTTGYAEAALNEPWACVEASYTVSYRDRWREGGKVWIVGDGQGVSLGRAAGWRPAGLRLETTDEAFNAQACNWAQENGIELLTASGEEGFDDIVLLDADEATIERAFGRLANGGVLNVVSPRSFERLARLDIGRLHYDNLSIVGTPSNDLSAAYKPIRSQLRAGGTTWILGAAGPLGQMHLQRAMEIPEHPSKIVATNLHAAKMAAVEKKFEQASRDADVELTFLSNDSFADTASLAERLHVEAGTRGFDDIVVLAPSEAAVEAAMPHLAQDAVMNVFAGLPRGTQAAFDLNAIVQRGVRFTGTSGSSIADLQHMCRLTENGKISPNRSVAAVAGLEGVAEGLKAVSEGRFPGKIVIYPNLNKALPLTPL
ncbi:MAG: alcohol dehydrogenase catalytic domain-containing protein, partial [Trueperaceae bacterium]